MSLTQEEQELLQLIQMQDKFFMRYGKGLDCHLPRAVMNIVARVLEDELDRLTIFNIIYPFKTRLIYAATSVVVMHPITEEDYRLIRDIRIRGRSTVQLTLIEVLELLDKHVPETSNVINTLYKQAKHLSLEDATAK